jgi:hypothetical protein
MRLGTGLGVQRKGSSHRWKPLLSNGNGDQTVDTTYYMLQLKLGTGLGVQRNGSSCRWKPLPSNGNGDLTVDTMYYMCNSVLYESINLL